MIYIKFDSKLRLRHSLKFRKKNLQKTLDYFKEKGLLIKERDFVEELDDEYVELDYTKFVIFYFIWLLSIPAILFFIIKLSIWGSVISLITSLILRGLTNKYHNHYIMGETFKELNKSIYEEEISKKDNS